GNYMTHTVVLQSFIRELQKYRKKPILVAVLFVSALLIPLYTVALKARALSDTTPMELLSLSVSSNTVDVSLEDGYTDMLGEVYEDLSGFNSIQFYYTSPSGGQTIESDANGDPQFINTLLRFPHNSEQGLWRPTLTLTDNASNSRTYTPDELIGLGFNAEVTIVSNTPDTTAPLLGGLTTESTTVDTATEIGYVLGNAIITDNATTIDGGNCFVVYTSPSGNQKSYGTLNQTTGDNYQMTVPFRQYAELGVWTLDVTIGDSVSNSRSYDSTELTNIGLPSTITVTGVQDVTPVTINSLDFNASFPPIGDTFANSAKVTILGEFSDNLSGIASMDINYYSQSSTQTAPGVTSIDGNTYQYTIFLPLYAATGVWLPVLESNDMAGNHITLTHEDLLALGFDLSLNFLTNETEEVVANGNITTDNEGNGATITEPFEASVTTPVAGQVSISQVALTEPLGSNDYLVFDQQYDISAPAATVENPLILNFTIDQSQLNGQNASTVVAFRNGTVVEDCINPNVTSPDPCISHRNTLAGGDVELVVRTSHASVWSLGYPAVTGPSYNFVSFKKPKKLAPQLNKVEEGEAIPVQFSLGGNQGLNVLPSYIAKSQRISCSTKQPIGDTTNIKTTKNGGLSYKSSSSSYVFKWKTLDKWENTCRQLILEFSNGEVIYSYFKFDD
ncbi:MAG: PxKF domain-containing protein, partial [Candidatus Saccharibacteria bacterium]|nr:PxKF domain-containing protein [Candidatus Saccharibacteria bacterium]